LSAAIEARAEGDLSPIEAAQAPSELRPLVDATNQVMRRLAGLLEHQKRFVRDTSHQLRTPLAVLKAQLQSALRGDLPAEAALHEMSHTVEGATQLANQMLALAKVEQLRQQGDAPVLDAAGIVRGVALDLSALIAARQLDFSIDTEPAPVRAHEWALRELTRNLLHNAIKFSPVGSRLAVRLSAAEGVARLVVADSGPGLGASQRERLFQPFARGSGSDNDDAVDRPEGTGLGLAICDEIVRSLGGQIALDNRVADGRVLGLDAQVRLPLADNRAS
jgi:two-component system sensor histidine kinase TctE